ncbi:MAG: hypothetical protein WBB01_09605 [Phormidesmis sp.]
MSLIALLLAMLTALLLSNVVDGLPELLWGWIYLPRWVLWVALLALVSWCIEGESSV